ncbi:Seven transmembrane MLO family protein [Trifolium repens]|nr:Seven transmembrane MLO family protein [Trifolium repens]
MAKGGDEERTLEKTPTWAVAVVCFVLLAISILIEHIIHAIGKWFKKRNKNALYEALEKVKEELMLMGFISLLLTVFQDPISNICISKEIGESWLPCSHAETKKKTKETKDRKLMEYFDPTPRRILATKGIDKCVDKGKIAFVSAYGIHQLHIFIFVLAIFHILQCILTLTFGRIKMRRWKTWENETKTLDYQFSNDPARFRFARDTTFGRRHMSIWNQSSISLWIVSFFRQFFGSISKADYLALRHGFVMTHLGQGIGAEFDFHDYIKRSLEADFKVVVGISPPIWLFAVLLLLTNTHGWYSYYWVPFIPLIIILLVGAKLQMIITEMGLSIHDRGEVIMGAPLVEPGDHLFWFNSPRFLLFLIHLVLFQNAFQLAFFSWSTYEFTINSCFHKTTADSIIRLTLGVAIQILCSYVTLPLYALVTQMGSTMRPTIFNNEGLATALKSWHHTAKKRVKHNRHSNNTTPFSSRPSSPTHGMSPVHLLHRHTAGNSDSLQTSPRASNYENERLDVEGGSTSPRNNRTGAHEIQMPVVESFSTREFQVTTRNEVGIGSKDFSFEKRQIG